MIRFKARRWTPKELAERPCRVIYGTERVWQKETGCRQIGSANDWRLHPKEDGMYLLYHRYGDIARLRHLADVLAQFFDVEIVSID